ncbi:GL26568 [Drosophila persimilis]|uniref:GL26568 n=1 Tax=Drosophila persimilis TaxID=7234 RepID=B4GSN0_DROPE|nr:GL26568 [Drosophila persimilis]
MKKSNRYKKEALREGLRDCGKSPMSGPKTSSVMDVASDDCNDDDLIENELNWGWDGPPVGVFCQVLL